MPAAPNREQIRSEEYQEFPITGPFGGVQSELPVDQIENYGFLNTTNFLFRKGAATLRPGFTSLTPWPSNQMEPCVGIADFFNSVGVRIQVAMTPTRLFEWNGAGWTQINGTVFTGTANQVFGFDVVNYKLCFSQGVDKVWLFDGLGTNYVQSSPNAPAAFYMAEIGLHLMVQNTVEAGVNFPQRYRWSGIGDPTDWISFSSGINDNINNLGPGQGIVKLGQYGYGWHQWGILQIQPTGYGPLPFIFTPIANSNVGNICPRSLAQFNKDGVECAAYVGKDNVYIFNQSSVIPIGDAPIDGRRRLGARSRIFSDIKSGVPSQVYGYVTQSINGQIFNAYWLIIPGVSVWVYNLDEGNWTVFTYSGMQTVANKFFAQQGVRIIDLIGLISGQNWTPATLNPTNPFDGFAIGYNNGQIAYIDFTNYSEISGVILSGKHIFNDRRHKKAVKKFRLVVQDLGSVTYTITLTSNTGQTQTQNVTIGTGSGDSISQVIEFSITGLRIQWSVSVPAKSPASIVEFAPIYDIAGEQRGGNVD